MYESTRGEHLAAMLNACATPSVGHFHELALINESSADVKHDLTLPFDAFIVGIEKDNASRVGRVVECGPQHATRDCFDIDSQYFKDRPDMQRALRGKYTGQHRPVIPPFLEHAKSRG